MTRPLRNPIPMTFEQYLWAQLHRDDNVGTLAYDLKRERQSDRRTGALPQPFTPESFEAHIRHHGACQEAVNALRQAAEEWRWTQAIWTRKKPRGRAAPG